MQDRRKGTPGRQQTGVPLYHDYRQGPDNRTDPMRIERKAVPPPACGHGKGFRGIS